MVNFSSGKENWYRSLIIEVGLLDGKRIIFEEEMDFELEKENLSYNFINNVSNIIDIVKAVVVERDIDDKYNPFKDLEKRYSEININDIDTMVIKRSDGANLINIQFSSYKYEANDIIFFNDNNEEGYKYGALDLIEEIIIDFKIKKINYKKKYFDSRDEELLRQKLYDNRTSGVLINFINDKNNIEKLNKEGLSYRFINNDELYYLNSKNEWILNKELFGIIYITNSKGKDIGIMDNSISSYLVDFLDTYSVETIKILNIEDDRGYISFKLIPKSKYSKETFDANIFVGKNFNVLPEGFIMIDDEDENLK